LILLCTAWARAQEPLLLEKRAWKGVVELDSVGRPPKEGVGAGEGAERQSERIEFLLVSSPPKRSVGWARLGLSMRESSGSYRLEVRTREGTGESVVSREGSGEGKLFPRVAGDLEPHSRKYRLEVRIQPNRLVTATTLAGRSRGRLATWRSVTARRPLLDGFRVEGEASSGLRLLEGRKRYIDHAARLPRVVTITWRIERLDPVVKGRLVDHRGRPIAGLKVTASTTNAGRIRRHLPPIRRTGTTGTDGRFSIDVYWGLWRVGVSGVRRDKLVIAGRRLEKDVAIKFDAVPDLLLKTQVYRLEALPRPRLLQGYFQGRVDAYLDYIRARVPKGRMRVALDMPPGEG